MAIPWVTVLKLVPWTEVIRTAPAVLDSARKLWDSASKRSSRPAPPPPSAGQPHEPTQPPSLQALGARVTYLESTVARLQEQALSSSELIKELAEQNANLIKRVEMNRVQVKRLGYAAVVIGIIAAVALSRALKG